MTETFDHSLQLPAGSAETPGASQSHTGPLTRSGDLRSALLSRWARPLRFVAVGGVCGLLQLALLAFFERLGLAGVPANVGAYLLSAQGNFLLSNHFIWHDRWSRRATSRDLGQRWLGFHGSIAGTFVLSQVVFIGTRILLPDLIASALGIGVAAVVNFLIQDRLTFRKIASGPRLSIVPMSSQPERGGHPDDIKSA